MNARALVLAAILGTPGLAVADSPPPAPPPPGTSPETSPDDEAYCAWRCRTRAGCFDDERCRVYRERPAPPAED